MGVVSMLILTTILLCVVLAGLVALTGTLS
jgi:hypothetical protein